MVATEKGATFGWFTASGYSWIGEILKLNAWGQDEMMTWAPFLQV